LNHSEHSTAIEIVPATAGDAAVILRMIRELAEYERLSHVVTATEYQIREMLFGEKPAAEVLIARYNGECAGFALFFPTFSTFLAQPGIYLEDLYVMQNVRGRGIGFALLTKLANIAARRGCARVEWAVLNWNEPSIQFYRRLGALPQDDWTTFRLNGEALLKLARTKDQSF
jgi:GNAT superfamily N-acetyltransferase